MKIIAALTLLDLRLILPALAGITVAIVSHLIRARRDHLRRAEENRSTFPAPDAMTFSRPEIVKTILSTDGRERLTIFQRPNRTFGFSTQSKKAEGEESYWSPIFLWGEGGIYDTIETAAREAAVETPWLKSSLTTAE